MGWPHLRGSSPATVAPPLPDMRLQIAVGCTIALTGLHAVCYGCIAPAKGEHAKKPHIAAHSVCTLVMFTLLTGLGIAYWLIIPDESRDGGPHSRIFGHSMPTEGITALMVGFQVYEVTMALAQRSLRGAGNQHLIHHILALTTSSLGLYYRVLYYFAPFFLGVVELSSVPLAIMDHFKAFRHLKEAYPGFAELNRVLFAVSFLAMRVVYWPFVCLRFWLDATSELSARAASGSSLAAHDIVLIIFMVMNVLLSALQAFWGSKVVAGIVRKIKGVNSEKDD